MGKPKLIFVALSLVAAFAIIIAVSTVNNHNSNRQIIAENDSNSTTKSNDVAEVYSVEKIDISSANQKFVDEYIGLSFDYPKNWIATTVDHPIKKGSKIVSIAGPEYIEKITINKYLYDHSYQGSKSFFTITYFSGIAEADWHLNDQSRGSFKNIEEYIENDRFKKINNVHQINGRSVYEVTQAGIQADLIFYIYAESSLYEVYFSSVDKIDRLNDIERSILSSIAIN